MKKKILLIFTICAGIVFIISVLYNVLLGALNPKSQNNEVFTIGLNATEDEIIEKIYKEGYIKNPQIFYFIRMIKGQQGKIEPGGFYLSKNLDSFQIAEKLAKTPDLKWVVIPEGLRKEQIGERLSKTFNWKNEELEKWNTVYTRMKFDYMEGVYFPDTYLIPVTENGLEIAERMIARFNEKFESYFDNFSKKNILWTTAVKIASIIQREAGGKDDMALISGVVWNRLEKGMKLEMDATIQYAVGKRDDNWWSTVTPDDIKNVDSAYNTYKYAGLPPYPISNPGLDAIEAVLNPVETDCFFYLHDENQKIHCAVMYQEHLKNIENYLNN